VLISDIRFPISDGTIVAAIKAGLTADGWGTGLNGGTELPDTLTARMFTVRDDSGPQVGSVSRRRQGVNVWAVGSVDALNMALDAMSACRLLPDGGPIAAAVNFTGPYLIPEDAPLTVNGDILTNYYFTFVCWVKGSKPT